MKGVAVWLFCACVAVVSVESSVITPSELQAAINEPDPSVIRGNDLPFFPLAPGAKLKLLRVDPALAMFVALIRIEPGATFPKHKHNGPVYDYTVSGNWAYREFDTEYGAGDFAADDGGRSHTLYNLSNDTSIDIFFWGFGKVDFTDENDNVVGSADWRSLTQAYIDYCSDPKNESPCQDIVASHKSTQHKEGESCARDKQNQK